MKAYPKYEEPHLLSDEDALQLVQIGSRYVRLPNPRVVEEIGAKPVFPTLRANRVRGRRNELWQDYILDDNQTPVWAFFWAHRFRGRPKGWTLAHIWARPHDPDSFSNLANLCIVPYPLQTLTDKKGPLVKYLKFHSFNTYGWVPVDEEVPTKPHAYDQIEWLYLDYSSCPKKNIDDYFRTRRDKKKRMLENMSGMEHWRTA